MKVLFLDDDDHRHRHVKSNLPFVTQVYTAEEAIKKLQSDKWDYVLLDHDLGGQIMVDSAESNTGMEVVRFMVSNVESVSASQVIVHSLNISAAKAMCRDLVRAGYKTDRKPFLIPAITLVLESIYEHAQREREQA